MATAHYSHEIAGIRTLWMIRFTAAFPHVEDTERGWPQFEILIPTPFNKDEWLILDPIHQKKKLKSLVRFQELCEEAKKRCEIQSTNSDSLEAKTQSASHEIENLGKLIDYFNEILKNLKKDKPDPPSLTSH